VVKKRFASPFFIFWPAALQQLTGLLADGTWVPMATVQFAAMTGARLAGWMAVRAKDWCVELTFLETWP
jgi:hypothetical protein